MPMLNVYVNLSPDDVFFNGYEKNNRDLITALI